MVLPRKYEITCIEVVHIHHAALLLRIKESCVSCGHSSVAALYSILQSLSSIQELLSSARKCFSFLNAIEGFT